MKYLPSPTFVIQVLLAILVIFAIASLAGLNNAILNPVSFVTGFFKKAPAA